MGAAWYWTHVIIWSPCAKIKCIMQVFSVTKLSPPEAWLGLPSISAELRTAALELPCSHPWAIFFCLGKCITHRKSKKSIVSQIDVSYICIYIYIPIFVSFFFVVCLNRIENFGLLPVRRTCHTLVEKKAGLLTTVEGLRGRQDKFARMVRNKTPLEVAVETETSLLWSKWWKISGEFDLDDILAEWNTKQTSWSYVRGLTDFASTVAHEYSPAPLETAKVSKTDASFANAARLWRVCVCFVWTPFLVLEIFESKGIVPLSLQEPATLHRNQHHCQGFFFPKCLASSCLVCLVCLVQSWNPFRSLSQANPAACVELLGVKLSFVSFPFFCFFSRSVGVSNGFDSLIVLSDARQNQGASSQSSAGESTSRSEKPCGE